MAGILLPGDIIRIEDKAYYSTKVSPIEKNEQKSRLEIGKSKTKKVKPNKKSRKPIQ